MAQKKSIHKKATKSATKKSAKKSVPQNTKKVTKTNVKGKAAGSGKKKKATPAKKPTVKKPAAKKAKPAKIQKSSSKSVKKKKPLSPSPAKPRKATGMSGSSQASARPSSSELTATERYNVGGLFACAIERTSDPDFKRLRSVLRELDLPSLEKDNLIRLSQGFTIPKLFADSIAQHKAESLVERLVKFAVGEGGYERKWKNDIRQVAAWLDVPGPAVEAIERRAGSK